MREARAEGERRAAVGLFSKTIPEDTL